MWEIKLNMDSHNTGDQHNNEPNPVEQPGLPKQSQDSSHHEFAVTESKMFNDSSKAGQDVQDLQANISKVSENAKLCLKIEELMDEPLK